MTTLLSTTIIPTFDDQSIDICKDADTNAGADVGAKRICFIAVFNRKTWRGLSLVIS